MANKEINDSLVEVLANAHSQWLLHPITVQLIKNIQSHKDSFVKKISVNASNDEVSSESIRRLSISVKDFDAALAIIKDFNVFQTLTTNQQ